MDVKLSVKTLQLREVFETLQSKSTLSLSSDGIEAIEKARNFLDQKVEEGGTYYGVNTGFGALYNTVVGKDKLSQLQVNLLRSHACGLGDYVPVEIVKLMLLTKAKSLSLGHSGIQLKVVELLMTLYNKEILPVIYEQGSLGASGDLAPLAHLSLPLIGEGEVWYKGEKRSAEQVLNQNKIAPAALKSKEGLALINGTQFMLSYGIYCVWKMHNLFQWANMIASMSLDAFNGSLCSFHEKLMQVRNQEGQIKVARKIRTILKESELQKEDQQKELQDPYSFRCIPQVHGAVLDTLGYVSGILEKELNAVTDNPTVLPDEDMIVSGGNFHGEPLALVLDQLAIAASELASISERRTYKLISGERGLPAFLQKESGLNSGFMIPQYTAASIVSQNKQLATPASVDTIDSSKGQEDHVSMGANAATKLLRVVLNVEKVLAIELMTAAQALEFRRPLHSSTLVEDVFTAYRKQVSFCSSDRWLHEDMEKTIEFLTKTNSIINEERV